jgi:hypothetical protein
MIDDIGIYEGLALLNCFSNTFLKVVFVGLPVYKKNAIH